MRSGPLPAARPGTQPAARPVWRPGTRADQQPSSRSAPEPAIARPPAASQPAAHVICKELTDLGLTAARLLGVLQSPDVQATWAATPDGGESLGAAVCAVEDVERTCARTAEPAAQACPHFPAVAGALVEPVDIGCAAGRGAHRGGGGGCGWAGAGLPGSGPAHACAAERPGRAELHGELGCLLAWRPPGWAACCLLVSGTARCCLLLTPSRQNVQAQVDVMETLHAASFVLPHVAHWGCVELNKAAGYALASCLQGANGALGSAKKCVVLLRLCTCPTANSGVAKEANRRPRLVHPLQGPTT